MLERKPNRKPSVRSGAAAEMPTPGPNAKRKNNRVANLGTRKVAQGDIAPSLRAVPDQAMARYRPARP
ncbi:MAG TPA: hypothetical protein PLF40_16665, partial [Kofleriaceae bacterium]|nr:hypothetical protein [Kofleriaceae bacterium]